MSTKAFFSNRIYKNTLSIEYMDSIDQTLIAFNRAKHYAFSTQVKEKRSNETKREKSLHLLVKEKFGLDDYYANSAVQAANAQLRSQEELKKLYINNKTEQIRSIKKKIKNDRSRLTTLKRIKPSFIKRSPAFPKNAREQKRENYYIVRFKKKTDLYDHAYAFEHTYLDPSIQELTTRIGFLTSKLNHMNLELKQLKTKIPSAVFGTKKQFKSQYTNEAYLEDHESWQAEWRASRHRKMVLSGRKDAAQGSFVFKYDREMNKLYLKAINGNLVSLDQVVFPYGQAKIEAAMETQMNCKNKKKHGKPIAWALEDHGDYYIVKCIIEIEANPNTNYSKSEGVIGIDCNVDHFALANINAKGQLLNSHTIPFNLDGKTSNQITKIIEAEAIGVVNIAVRANKPIVLEKIDTTTSKVTGAYGNKKANRKMSMFAYKKMITAIKARAEKMGVAVFEVNPAYTSQIGKIKYMKRFGISIHEAASYVVARRGMGFKETLPPVLGALLPEKIIGAHHWMQWKYVTKHLKEIRNHTFYLSELFDVDRFHETGELFASGALADLEQKGLSKLKSRKTAS